MNRVIFSLLCLASFLGELRSRRRRLFWKKTGRGLPRGGPSSVWFHTLSVGEVSGAGALALAVKEQFPHLRVVLTVATSAGYEAARERLGGRLEVYPGPLLCSRVLERYFQALSPRLFVLVESDLWPNFLYYLRDKGVPLLLVNAALSERSRRRLARLPRLARWLYRPFRVLAAASPEDQARLSSLLPEASVLYLGNLKYDFPPPRAEEVEGLRQELSPYLRPPTVVAGSTHPGEEILLLEAFRLLGRGTLILCPRHPERAEELLALARAAGFSAARRSRPFPAPVIVVDTLGELRALYGLAEVALVGGTLVPVGGHNLLEPAALGVPLVFGPYVESVASVARELVASGGGLPAPPEPAALARALEKALSERQSRGEAARAVYQTHQGAVERYLRLFAQFL
ncbi:3-deoxy-D-manno-octulosonic acid transferase [Thermosulfurimonas marina]|uniref:3-deoxy-D-manno-octulosonic acid transferase n=1 Tax=Thermosulfurimonas marina TaxID=2047767 RepID=UPI00144AD7BC|nr:glycosyltransferase N-terminal domain-containing protein [Thermosulfurimonas marina]